MSLDQLSPPRALTLRVPFGGRRLVSARLALRPMLVCALLLVLTAVVVLLALMLGKIVYSPGEVLATLRGLGTPQQELFILDYRLPQAVAGPAFGAMLGVAGALFQTITRNPLGSPDIIGFTAGSSAGGVAVVALVGSSHYLVAGGALLGGAVVAVLVMLLSRGGGVAGFRLIIAGIALSAMLTSIETWIVLTADLQLAQIAALWGAGSLNGAHFSYLLPPMLVGLGTVLLAVIFLSRRLDLVEMGDDASSALGMSPASTRLLAVAAGVVLVAMVTAAAGPIAFVALAAPHIGRRLAASSGAALLPAACAGAFLLASADLAAQHAIPGHTYPVGVVTVAVGGLYLIALLINQNRKAAV
ncbi:MAG: iron chelate uptake ABC transporter family permease subunit [Actinomycetales bacterium]|nr:iron chelate uptake ABC transporter family permease subunit [Actinomycetales bacterium]